MAALLMTAQNDKNFQKLKLYKVSTCFLYVHLTA